jgi:hypothetical protein
MTPTMHRSLRHEYELYVREEIEHYKDSVSRSTLLSIGDEAVCSLQDQTQLPMTEMLLCEEVDRIISRRLRLPTYATWKRRRFRLQEKFRSPAHWNLSPNDALVRVMHPAIEGHVLVASPAGEGPALYLAANGCDVTAVDEEPDMVRRVLSAAGAAGLAVRGYVSNLSDWSPDVGLRAVVCSAAAFAGLSPRERERVIDILQGATLDGGVHLVETLVAGDSALSFEELRSRYHGWDVTVDSGGPGATPTFIARKIDA